MEALTSAISAVKATNSRKPLMKLSRYRQRSRIPVEICHLKAAGKDNWNKIDSVIAIVESARKVKALPLPPICIRIRRQQQD